MSSPEVFVIVGAGLAGAKAAETLRAEGFQGRVVLLGEEGHRPYDRPPLSKGYLLGTTDPEKVYVHPPAFYAEHDIELRTGHRVVALDRAAAEVSLHDGERLGYSRLLLATGARPRTLSVPGADLPGVHYLRTLDDSDRLKAAFSASPRVVVVGAGWIGLEGAAAARAAGCEVTVVEPQPTPLYGVLGPELGEVYAALHRSHGVHLHTGTGVSALTGGPDGVRAVVTDTGAELPAEVVLVGVGALPNDELARAAGLEVDNGVRVDSSLATLTDPAVFAAGDVMRADHPRYGRPIRVEHWATALHSGPAAARSMLGRGTPYDRVPYFYSDQYELGMEFSGLVTPGGYDQVVYRGDRDGGEFIAFWLSGTTVVAGMNVNVWDVTGPIQELVRSGASVDPQRLADPAVPLEEVAG